LKRALTILVAFAPATPALAQAIDPNKKYAWGENVGFLNFADAGNPPGSQAAFAHPTFLEGFVWGENIGWINLDDPNVFVALACPADINNDGLLNFFDVAAYIALYNANDPAADLAAPFGTLNFFDLAAYIGLYNAGCPS